MIHSAVFKNPFLTWVLLSALLYSGLFWAYYGGLISYVLAADFTHIAISIMAMLIYCNISLGLLSWELQKMIVSPPSDAETSHFYTHFDCVGLFMAVAPTLGLLGTVIGLSRLMHDAATVNIDTIVSLLGTGTGAALFPTAVGLVLVLVLTVQRFLLIHSFRIHGFAQEL